MKKCPFCAEEIQDAAIKCKYCSEKFSAVETNINKPLRKSSNNPSETARAITKGIKQKEVDDMQLGCFSFIAFIIALLFGMLSKSWVLGIIIFIVGAFLIGQWYHKE